MSDKATILIVDDAEVNVILLEDILENLGYDVLSAGSAKEAADILNRQLPQLVLLDIMMPDVDGFEVLRRLGANPETRLIPVVVLSALNSNEDIVRAYNLGAKDFITKPILMEKLINSGSVNLNL